MYLPITQWLDQNPILFPCGRNRRSNHVTPLSLCHHTLNLRLLTLILLLFIGPPPLHSPPPYHTAPPHHAAPPLHRRIFET
jgi:hypothetical protein